MRHIFLLACFMLLFTACRKAMIPPTTLDSAAIPWQDSSARHPRDAQLTSLINKYNRLGLPGISLLVTDQHGTWIGAAGKADIANNVDFAPTQVSKIASVTKFMMGVLVFKMMEDSIHSRLGYSD